MSTTKIDHRIALAILVWAGGLSACTAIFDGSRHQGGEAVDGSDDAGSDGSVVDVCSRASTASCGAPVDEACPPIVQTTLPMILEGEALGQIRPTVLYEAQEGLRSSLALETVEAGGELHGTALLAAIDGTRPLRFDIPLHDFLAAEPGAFRYNAGTDGILEIDSASSVAFAREEILPSIGVMIGDAPNAQFFKGHTDLVSLQSNLGRFSLAEGEDLLDDVGATSIATIARTRSEDDVVLEAMFNVSSGPPLMLNETHGAPGDSRLRIASSTSYFVVLYDGDGTFWTWSVMGFDAPPLVEFVRAGQAGKMAWVAIDAQTHVLVHYRSGSIHFTPYSCEDTTCELIPVIINPPSVSALAPTAEVPAAVKLPDGRVGALVTERYEGGDRLVLQVLEASLESISLPRVPLLDLRSSGERVVDAAVRFVGAPGANTILVAALIGEDEEVGSRVVLTGLRACPE